MISGTYTA